MQWDHYRWFDLLVYGSFAANLINSLSSTLGLCYSFSIFF